MDAHSQEVYLKKRLQGFLGEMLKMGTLKGFKHFATYMRGREEMVISIVNEPQTTHHTYVSESSGTGFSSPDRSGSLTSQNLPYDKRSLLISMRSQMNLSTAPTGIGLPPASPSDQETQIGGENSTLFLVAGYARYCCPYVWVRSNHERLIKLTGDSANDKDCPLKLKTTVGWNNSDFNVWDIVAELVKLCCYPAPTNPYEIDFDYFDNLTLPEQVLSTAAMCNFLQKVLVHVPDDKAYISKVFEEIQILSKLHFSALQKLAKSGGIPILNQHLQASSRRQHRTSGSSASSRQRYPSSGGNYWGGQQAPTRGHTFSQY
ncbi:uncharacterized protein LOC132544295 [Ylistrum balloti]|uniref:uncharacterized protein LOC132544295 n=1 Tax=Ylistrum balloti TaxID=509963 RepID=UPI002905981E|nr:uncharacterized protein LOC132544295 [Ylistrum balloti]